MTKVILGMTMSLDGFIRDQHGSVELLHPDLAAARDTAIMQEAIRTTGAVVMGCRAYDMGDGDFTDYEFQTPIFVLTHQAPTTVTKGENDRLRFHFVADGIASAIARAKAAAGDRDVAIIGGAQTFQQCLNAGVADELQIAIRPVLLGAGLRLFEQIDAASVTLETIAVMETPTTTELRFRVVR
jgi:dihydrofolate reductase